MGPVVRVVWCQQITTLEKRAHNVLGSFNASCPLLRVKGLGSCGESELDWEGVQGGA